MIVNPVRPHRVEPRVKKRRPKSFPFMRNLGKHCVSSWYNKSSEVNFMPFGKTLIVWQKGCSIASRAFN